MRGHNVYFIVQEGKLSQNYPCQPFLSGPLSEILYKNSEMLLSIVTFLICFDIYSVIFDAGKILNEPHHASKTYILQEFDLLDPACS